MADLSRLIQQAISKGISQRLSGTLETFVRDEVLRELRLRGIYPMKTQRKAKNLPLVESRNLNKKIGSLVMDRVKNGVSEQLRFKLQGIQPHNQADAIDPDELQRMIKKAIQTKLSRKLR